jgi:hypothetical protein
MAVNTDFDPSVTLNLANVGAVAGTTSTFTSTAASAGLINGKFVTSLAAQTNAASPTVDANTGLAFNALAANQTCALGFGQNAAGALLLAQGQIIATGAGVTTTVGALINEPQFPPLPLNFLPLAYTIVRVAPSGAPWTPGTGSWTASGVSATTFANIGQIPNRPQAS